MEMKLNKYFKISVFTVVIMSISLLLTACDTDDNTDSASGNYSTSSLRSTLDDVTLKYGNITLNNKSGSLLGGLFCSAEDKIFFSNFNDNGYIYSYDKKTEKSELVVKMPARFINYYNGNLYFLFIYDDDYFDACNMAFVGELYRFNIQSGECLKLVDSQIITGLVVTNEGIYYNQIPTPGSSLDPPELWRLGFGESEAELCDYRYVLRNDDCIIDENGIHRLTDNKLSIASDLPIDIRIDENSVKGACVYKNKLITYSNRVLNIDDLSDGSVFSVKVSELEKLNNNIEIDFSDFVILDDYLYIAYNSSFLCRICLSDNEAEFICDTEGQFTFSKLYTDDESLYAFCHKEGKTVRLELYEDKITTKELK